jgi:hypothetical protein
MPMLSPKTKYILSQTKYNLSGTKIFCLRQNILSYDIKFISATCKSNEIALPDETVNFCTKEVIFTVCDSKKRRFFCGAIISSALRLRSPNFMWVMSLTQLRDHTLRSFPSLKLVSVEAVKPSQSEIHFAGHYIRAKNKSD